MDSVLVHNTSFGQPFYVHTPRCVDDVLRFRDLLVEGWHSLAERFDDRSDFNDQSFILRCLDAALCRDNSRQLFVFTSKNNKPLGFILAEDGSEGAERTTLFIYAAYSNGKFMNAPSAGIGFVEKWARLAGYSKIRLLSRRLNGSAMRLFRRKLGLKPVGVLFEKTLESV